MSRRLFGTDGVRGVANETITPELALSLGMAAGRWMREQGLTRRAVIGRDTRRSGPMLGAALASGLCSAGIEVATLGVVPTPTVSFAARTGEFGLGVVISASHNPAPDNGIKFLGHDGRKLSDEAELLIEALLGAVPADRFSGADVGYLHPDTELIEAYMAFLLGIVPEGLAGLKVAVDAAHGAAHELAPRVLRALGAIVSPIGVTPDGMNINAEGGATKPHVIQQSTVASGSDVGVAFDGDADRAVFSDETGRLINGDRTMGVWATHRQRDGGLHPPTVVGTVMSNGGFEEYLRSNGIGLERTPVGDKYVSQKLDETGAQIGGEQSGHIVFPHHGPTGDGLVTMLEFLGVLRQAGCPASTFIDAYGAWPQLLVNVHVSALAGWDQGRAVCAALEEGRAALGTGGRLVVRASGTQPMVRVMVEARDGALRDEVAQRIVAAMTDEIGAKVYSRVDLTHSLGE
ncbi:MAG: phosphoglucosamine mutase [Fimbriimonas ginsengisoli]|uniref:Phosphoglucosamine mutase n=1 Tax=Fimbriimonas ginsengisoli TaxID=1005039 RepID=A0A931LQL0_FIMGI|nr:phosphoglucosamine mutase [Fimbriimonas ginsengisoli]